MKTDVLAVLLELGADPLHPVDEREKSRGATIRPYCQRRHLRTLCA
jgi:hypothetical protein